MALFKLSHVSSEDDVANQTFDAYHIPRYVEIDQNLFWTYISVFAGGILLPAPTNWLADALKEMSGPSQGGFGTVLG